MQPRLAYLALALLAGLFGAAAELALIASTRPWMPPLFWRAALELALLWCGTAAAVVVLRWLTLRTPANAGAFLCGPMGFAAAWFVARIDGGAKLDSGPVAVIGLLALGGLLLAHRKLDRALARLPLTGRWSTWLIAIVALTAWSEQRRRARLPVAPATNAAADAQNVLWISLDTLRADRLGCYGHPGGLTPNLDALAREGVVFETLTCPMPLTAPSHTAMLTGLMPHESHVSTNGHRLAIETPTLPRLLSGEGYATGGFVSGFPLIHRSCQFADQFRWYDDEFSAAVPLCEGARLSPLGGAALRALRHFKRWRDPLDRPGDRTVDRALEWLDDDEPADRPFFLFVHLYDVHGEYQPHDPGVERSRFFRVHSDLDRFAVIADPAERAHLEKLYDGEVRFVDAQVARLFEALRRSGRYDHTLIVVTSDHGESLGEHGIWYEHVAPWHVETHVPALLKLPRGEAAGTRVRGPAQTTDLAATVTALVGASFELPGTSLVGAIERGEIGPRRIFCQSVFDSSKIQHLVSISDGRHKLVHRLPDWDGSSNRIVPAHDSLYDLATDPGETHDLLATGALPEGLDLEAWRAELTAYQQLCLASSGGGIDASLAESLRQLGYGN